MSDGEKILKALDSTVEDIIWDGDTIDYRIASALRTFAAKIEQELGIRERVSVFTLICPVCKGDGPCADCEAGR